MKEHSPTYSMKPTLPWYQNPEYDTTEENKTTDYLSHTTKRKKILNKILPNGIQQYRTEIIHFKQVFYSRNARVVSTLENQCNSQCQKMKNKKPYDHLNQCRTIWQKSTPIQFQNSQEMIIIKEFPQSV